MKHYFISILLNFLSYHSFSQTWNIYNDSLSHYFNTGEYGKGIIVGEKAIHAAKLEFGETHPNYAKSLNNLAVIYQAAGSSEKAEPLLIQVINIQKKVLGENHPDYAKGLYNLAVLYEEMGQLEKAIPLYIQLTDIYRKVLGGNHPDYAEMLNNLAILYDDMGLYESAEPLYIEAIRINKKALGETHPNYAKSLNNLAALYKAKGQYEKAEPLYIQALEIKKKALGESHPDYATGLVNLAQLYQEIGQYEKAEPGLLQAMEIRKQALGENHLDYANSLNNLGALYQIIGQFSKAEPLFLQALEIRGNILGEAHPDYATSLNNLAILYQNNGQLEKAEPLLLHSLEISRKVYGELHRGHAGSLNNLAVLYQEMGKYNKAEPLYLQAIEIAKKSLGENHPDYALSLDNLSLLYQAMGEYGKAEPLSLENNKIVLENLKKTFTVLSEKEKANYLDNNSVIIESVNSFLYYHRKASPAFVTNNFNLQLFFKSLLLADSRIMQEALSHNRDTGISHMFRDWQVSKTLLAKQYSLPIIDRRQDLGNIENKTETQEKELSRRSTEFRNQNVSLQITIKDVQNNLQQDEAAIEFVRFRLFNKKWTDSIMYAAYILHKDDVVPSFIPLCEEKQLQKIFDNAGNNATSMSGSLYRGIKIPGKSSEALLGKELYQLIWQPLEPFLKGISKIAYSPSGKIYSIALQALPVDSTHVLMDKYKLHQYISTRQLALRNTEKQTTRPGNIILFGDASFTMDSVQLVKQKFSSAGNELATGSVYAPQNRGAGNSNWNDLPGTAEEVKKIKQLFDQDKISSRSFVQTAATEEKLKSLNGYSPQILHIATHGFFLPLPDNKKENTGFDKGNSYTLANDPLLRSGLMFAGCNYAWSGKTPVDGVEDGIATAYEISQLNLSNTELVVLSACETALGDVKGSEGVFGLQRGFKMAGVKKMIVSLWQVPDKETAELMTTFYAKWLNGKSLTESFYDAQSDMRKKYPAYYWAAFVLVE
jgi:CHAT domain-containing protein/Flp pilus assembly protein TadD